MDENEIDADELISDSGDPRGHVYEKDFADDAEPRVDWWSLEGQISETRIEELQAGKKPTNKEAKLLWEAHMSHCFEEPDDDFMPGLWFCTCPPGIDLPALIVVLCCGYSFSGAARKIFGAYENEEDAMAALRRKFYFCDDFNDLLPGAESLHGVRSTEVL